MHYHSSSALTSREASVTTQEHLIVKMYDDKRINLGLVFHSY